MIYVYMNVSYTHTHFAVSAFQMHSGRQRPCTCLSYYWIYLIHKSYIQSNIFLLKFWPDKIKAQLETKLWLLLSLT